MCHTLSPSIVASLKAECSPVDDEMAKAAASPQHYKYTLVEELSHGFQSSPSLAKRREGGWDKGMVIVRILKVSLLLPDTLRYLGYFI